MAAVKDEIKGDLIVIEKLNLPEVFTSEGVDSLIKEVENKVISIVPDTSTDKGRKAIASMAYKVSQCKKPLEDAGKKMVAEQKAKIKVVDDARIRLIKQLDVVRDKVRQPLTEWEAEQERIKAEAAKKEAERMNYIDSICTALEDYSRQANPIIHSQSEISEWIKEIELCIINESFEEFEQRARTAKETALHALKVSLEVRIKADKEKEQRRAEEKKLAEERKAREDEEKRLEAERKQLEVEKAEVERQKREAREAEERKIREAEEQQERERIAKEAAEKAKQEERERIKLEKEEAERKAQLAREEEDRRKATLPDKERLLERSFHLRKLQASMYANTDEAHQVLCQFTEKFLNVMNDFEENIKKL